MCSSRIEPSQAVATCVRRRATPRELLLPPGRGKARRGVERLGPAGTRPLAATLRPPPQPSPCPGEGAGRGGQEGAPFLSLPGRCHRGRLRSRQDRRLSPLRPRATAAAPASVTTPQQNETETRPVPRSRRGTPEPPLSKGPRRRLSRARPLGPVTEPTGAQRAPS